MCISLSVTPIIEETSSKHITLIHTIMFRTKIAQNLRIFRIISVMTYLYVDLWRYMYMDSDDYPDESTHCLECHDSMYKQIRSCQMADFVST